MPEIRYPQWQGAWHDALLELDPKKLRQKVIDAEAAIFKRLQELSDDRTDHMEERLALNDAISGLRALKVEQLKFPDWNSK